MLSLDSPYILAAITVYCLLVLVYWYGQRTKAWKWSEYGMMLAAVAAGLIMLTYFEGIKVFIYFLVCSAVGSVAEYIFGFLFHKTLGKRIWTYQSFSVDGYTSILMIPFWGNAGIIFLAIAKFLNL